MSIINDNEWKKIFIQDISDKLKISKKEYDIYKKTGKIVHLQQAGNKLFSAVENWMQVKYSQRIASYQQLKKIVRKNKSDLQLVVRVSRLHYFFYQNVVVDDPEDIAFEYKEIYDVMVKRLKNQQVKR